MPFIWNGMKIPQEKPPGQSSRRNWRSPLHLYLIFFLLSFLFFSFFRCASSLGIFLFIHLYSSLISISLSLSLSLFLSLSLCIFFSPSLSSSHSLLLLFFLFHFEVAQVKSPEVSETGKVAAVIHLSPKNDALFYLSNNKIYFKIVNSSISDLQIA